MTPSASSAEPPTAQRPDAPPRGPHHIVRVETVGELRRLWHAMARALRRDLSATSRLAEDPAGTLRELGYDVRRDALRALRAALVV